MCECLELFSNNFDFHCWPTFAANLRGTEEEEEEGEIVFTWVRVCCVCAQCLVFLFITFLRAAVHLRARPRVSRPESRCRHPEKASAVLAS